MCECYAKNTSSPLNELRKEVYGYLFTGYYSTTGCSLRTLLIMPDFQRLKCLNFSPVGFTQSVYR